MNRKYQITAYILILFAGLYARDLRAQCVSKTGEQQVFVADRTPIRRGPGLNYPIADFLSKGRCMKLEQVSADKQWVLVENQKLLGWVLAKDIRGSLGEKSAAKTEVLESAAATPKQVASSKAKPVFVVTKKKLQLRKEPQIKAAKLKTWIAKGEKLSAVSISKNERFIQVRDRRGVTGWVSRKSVRARVQVLAKLPHSNRAPAPETLVANDVLEPTQSTTSELMPAEVQEPAVTLQEDQTELAESDPAPTDSVAINNDTADVSSIQEDPETQVELFFSLAALFPTQKLHSNGAAPIRRYQISATTAGAMIEARFKNLGIFEGRGLYSFAFLPNLAAQENNAAKVSGQLHMLRLVLGLPIHVGSQYSFSFTPEAGYMLDLFGIQPAFAGAPAQFVSRHSHGLSLGGSAKLPLASESKIALHGEVAGLLGITQEYPIDLGSPGLTLGVLWGLGIAMEFLPGVQGQLKYEMRYARAPTSGQSSYDPSITSAVQTFSQHAVSLGLGFAL